MSKLYFSLILKSNVELNVWSTQLTFICVKLTIETPKKGLKHVQSQL